MVLEQMSVILFFVGLFGMVSASSLGVYPPQRTDVDAVTLGTLTPLGDPNTVPAADRTKTLSCWASDADRAGLPIVVSGVGEAFEWVDVILDGVSIENFRIVDGWEPSIGDIGGVAYPVPEGASGEIVNVEVVIRLTSSSQEVTVSKDGAIRYENLQFPLVESSIRIGHLLNGGPSIPDGDNFGRALAMVDDVDGDGRNDIVVGAFGDDTGDTNSGAIFVLGLTADGSARVIRKIASETNGGPKLSAFQFFGTSVCWLADIDGDGRGEIAVGAQGASTGGDPTGSVFILGLESDGSAKVFQRISDGLGGGPSSLEANDLFGSSVAWIGDVNQNGVESDIAIGIIGDDSAGGNFGAVLLMEIASDGMGTVIKKIVGVSGGVTGPELTSGDNFGMSVDRIWRTDRVVGEDDAQLVAGAYGDDTGGVNTGAVYILDVSSTGVVAMQGKIASNTGGVANFLTGSAFGTSACWVGDIDGDGVAKEIAVGAYLDSTNGAGRGAVYLMSIGTDGNVEWYYKVASSQNGGPQLADGDEFGMSVSMVPDFKGEGRMNRLAVGAWHVDSDGGGNRGAVILLEIAELSDVNSEPVIEGAAEAVEDVDDLDATMSLVGGTGFAMGLPLIDPQGVDKSRRVLPLSVLTDVFDAVNDIRIVNVSLGGSPCGDFDIVSDWPSTANNSRRIGVACIGTPPVDVGSYVSAEMWYFDVVNTTLRKVSSGDAVARADTCLSYLHDSLSANSLDVQKISSDGGSSVIVSGYFGALNLSEASVFGSALESSCRSEWMANSRLAIESTPADAAVDTFVFWVFIGARPCRDVHWLNSSAVECIAPPGIGTNIRVYVVFDGVLHPVNDKLSYDSIISPPTKVISAFSTLDYQGGSKLDIDIPLAEYMHGSERYAGLSLTGIVLGSLFQASAPTPSFTGTMTISQLPAPAGYGVNRTVSICFSDDLGLGTTFFSSASDDISLPNNPSIACSATNPSILLDYAPPTILTVTPSADLDPLGGQTLSITGQGFGSPTKTTEEGISPIVTIGTRNCLSVTHSSNQLIRCVTPALSGSPLTVKVSIGGATSVDGVTVSVLQVSLVSVAPRQVLPAAPGLRTLDFSLVVFGAEEVTRVFVGAVECPSIEILAEDSIMCYNLPVPSVWETDDSWLYTRSSNESVSRRAVLRVEPPPSILAINTPNDVPTAGGVNIQVVGSGLGLEDTDLDSVIVGGSLETALEELASNISINSTALQVATRDEAVVLKLSQGLAELTSTTGSSVQALLPSGCGTKIPVRVRTAWELLSDPFEIDYDPPTLNMVSLANETERAVLYPGMTGIAVDLCGSNLAPRSDDIDSVFIGGVACENVVSLSNECVRCEDFDTIMTTTTPASAWPANTVEVVVCGQSTGPILGRADLIGAPIIQQATPPQGSRGDTISLSGSGMGEDDSYVVGIVVGGLLETAAKVAAFELPSSSVATANESIFVTATYVSRDRLTFQLPAGIGVNIPVRFVTNTGLLSSEVLIGYVPPMILSVTPSVILAGETDVEVLVCGTNFPTRQEDIDLLELGGVECMDVIVSEEDGCVLCTGFDAPRSLGTNKPVAWPGTGVHLVAAEASASAPNLVSFVNPPKVTQLNPPSGSPGDVVTIFGTGFGASSADVTDVKVGETSCASFTWVSPTEMTCTIANPHPIWSSATNDDVIPNVQVVVVLRSGVTNEASTDGTPGLVPSGGVRVRPNPFGSPVGVVAWRPVGQPGSLQLRWRFSGPLLERARIDTEYNNSVAPAVVSTFRIQVSDEPNFDSSSLAFTEVSTARDASITRPTDSTVSDPSNELSWEWHESRVPALTNLPLFVRVRGENGDGPTDWAFAVDPDPRRGVQMPVGEDRIPESCLQDEYLTTQKDVDEYACNDCPAGAVCGGLGADNVTGIEGYWRVPWSTDALGFAECPIEGSCLGHSGTLRTDTSSSSSSFTSTTSSNLSVSQLWRNTDEVDRPISVSVSNLIPAEHESCAPGHRGVLCSSCETNYFPGVGGVCTACGNRVWIAGRFALLTFAILVVFSFLLFRAWRSRLQTSSKEVQITKIIFTHLQTVAIVGAVQIRWPTTARGFFNVVDAGSSFTTSGLAVECLMGEDASSPFLRTIVIALMPLSLVAFAMIFWMVFQCFERRIPACQRCTEGDAKPRKSIQDPPQPINEETESSIRQSSGAAALPLSPITPEESISSKVSEEISAAARQNKRGFWGQWKERIFLSLVVLAFLVHTPLTTAAFRLMTCRPVSAEDDEENSQLRLVMDLDINCETPANASLITAISVPIIVLVSLGVPIGVAVFLRCLGIENLKSLKWRERLGFLYNGYRSTQFYWESVVLLRKVSLAFVTTTLAPSGGGMQMTTALLVILVAMAMHARFQPYQSNVINMLEGTALVASAITLVGGVFVIIESVGEVGATANGIVGPAASIMIVVVNVLFFILALLLLSSRARKSLTNILRSVQGRLGVHQNTQKRSSIFQQQNPIHK